MEGQVCYFVAFCYFPPQKSKYYRVGEEEEPFSCLEKDIIYFQQKGRVFVVGDFNARTSNTQAATTQADKDFMGSILEHHSGDYLERQSEDSGGGITHFGEELIHMTSRCGLIICNGISQYPQSGAFTCHTNMGSSVVDYLLMEANHLELLRSFQVEALPPKSNRTPLFFSFLL